ncbi:MAG: pantoate--beta-alanine ligase [Verrucomicrobia bacterium]|nr:pantoate--beta-alanine ligase [Verrucomicrobiota bacterium]MDA1005412.1 pantoate--beta-alanine ligase [Verrucomicrobiota bacterium]
MQLIESPATLPALRAAWPKPTALVPTMGALHAGHIALLREARRLVGPHGTVLLSLFVNPLQFDRPSDLTAYPRTGDADIAIAKAEGVDALFAPSADDFYAPDHSITVAESLLTKRLCGATRPGHFDGVCTVVLKLFNLLQPDHAVFGKKDYQQLAVIRRMVRDLAVPVTIHGVETVREPDGLALSSRNLRLTTPQRADAPRIRRALLAARDIAPTGEQRPEIYLNAARQHLEQSPAGVRIDYLELVDRHTLQPVAKVTAPVLLATAVFYDEVRLIDNIEIG